MFYKEYKPIESLSNYVKCIWVLENELYDDAVNVVFPDGCMELIFHFGPPFKRISSGLQQVQEKSILVGQLNKPLSLQATGSAGIIGVRFHPWGLHPLVNIPLQHITNSEIHIQQVGVMMPMNWRRKFTNRIKMLLWAKYSSFCSNKPIKFPTKLKD